MKDLWKDLFILGVIAIFAIVFATVLSRGINIISTATESGYDAAWHLDVSTVQEDGYQASQMNTFTMCLAHQRMELGGILAFIGGGGLLLCVHWIFRFVKMELGVQEARREETRRKRKRRYI